MTETLVTTAEQELQSLLDWLHVDPIDLKHGFTAHEGCDVRREAMVDVAKEVQRRLDLISRGYDGWRSRCLVAEKKNEEYVVELQKLREELREAKYGTPCDGASHTHGR